MPDFYVYMLQCSDGSYYVGSTDDIAERLNHHIQKIPGVNSYVSKRLPITLVFAEGFSSRDEAKAFEWQLKGWSRKKKEALISGGVEAVQKVTLKGKFTQFPAHPSTKLREDGRETFSKDESLRLAFTPEPCRGVREDGREIPLQKEKPKVKSISITIKEETEKTTYSNEHLREISEVVHFLSSSHKNLQESQ